MLRSAFCLIGAALALACVNQPPADEGAGETGEPGELPCEVHEDCPDDDLCLLGVCQSFGSKRRPYRDAWREELVLSAADFERLRVGGTRVHDNFVNRGDIEVVYAEGASEIVVEVQRFTVARDQNTADEAFARMRLWAYALEVPKPPGETIADSVCETDFCHLRNYYEGQLQPVRDGVNFRVTLPAGWDGELELETEDNLEEEAYPDRGDLRVDGLAGSLRATLDSGRVSVRLAADYPHFPGCPLDDACLAAGLAPDCGCTEFAAVAITARVAEAAEIVVDVPADNTYAASLQNDEAQLELGCVVDIGCDVFADCELDPDTLDTLALARAAINHPGDPAPPGAGIRVELHSGACESIAFAEPAEDWTEGLAVELRGSVRLCSGCL